MKKLFSVSYIILLLSCVSTISKNDVASEYFNVGNAFFKIEQYSESQDYYEKVLDIDKDFHKARYNLIYSLMAQDKFNEASKHIDYLYSKDASNLKVKSLEAYLYYSRGDLDKSLELYMELYNGGDQSKDVRLNITKINYQLKRYEIALVYISELLKEYNDLELYQIAALVANEYQDYELAASFFEAYIDAGGKDIVMLEKLASIYNVSEDFGNLKRILGFILQYDDGEQENLKGDTFFELADISLFYDNDFKKGYDYLNNAVDSGFNDVEKINELLDKPDLIEIEKIRQIFIDAQLLEAEPTE